MPGIAFLYVSPKICDHLYPTVTGWFGREHPFAFDLGKLDWAKGARRFDTGTPPIVNAAVARAGIELIASVGLERIRSWTETLSRRLVEGGRARGFAVLGTTDSTRKAPTTAFRVRDAHAAEAALRSRGILASARGPAIRLAPHFYNTLEEIDRALDALAEVVPPEERA